MYMTLYILSYFAGVFAGLVDVLQPLGVQLPSQLLHSPHLALQREGQKRRRQESGRGHGTKKRDTRNFYDRCISLLNLYARKANLIFSIPCRDTLMDLIKGTSKHQ